MLCNISYKNSATLDASAGDPEWSSRAPICVKSRERAASARSGFPVSEITVYEPKWSDRKMLHGTDKGYQRQGRDRQLRL